MKKMRRSRRQKRRAEIVGCNGKERWYGRKVQFMK